MKPKRLGVASLRQPSSPHRWGRRCQPRDTTLALTVDAEHHADRGLPDRVPGHTLVAAGVRGPHVVDGQEPLRTDVEFPTFRHLHPILEQNRAEITGESDSAADRVCPGWGGAACQGLTEGNLEVELSGGLIKVLRTNSVGHTWPPCLRRPRGCEQTGSWAFPGSGRDVGHRLRRWTRNLHYLGQDRRLGHTGKASESQPRRPRRHQPHPRGSFPGNHCTGPPAIPASGHIADQALVYMFNTVTHFHWV